MTPEELKHKEAEVTDGLQAWAATRLSPGQTLQVQLRLSIKIEGQIPKHPKINKVDCQITESTWQQLLALPVEQKWQTRILKLLYPSNKRVLIGNYYEFPYVRRFNYWLRQNSMRIQLMPDPNEPIHVKCYYRLFNVEYQATARSNEA